jgi:hypothetical protein
MSCNAERPIIFPMPLYFQLHTAVNYQQPLRVISMLDASRLQQGQYALAQEY